MLPFLTTAQRHSVKQELKFWSKVDSMRDRWISNSSGQLETIAVRQGVRELARLFSAFDRGRRRKTEASRPALLAKTLCLTRLESSTN